MEADINRVRPINIGGLDYIEQDDRKRMANINEWLTTSADLLSPFLFFIGIILAGALAFFQGAWWPPLVFAAASFVALYMRNFFRRAAYLTNLKYFETDTGEMISKIYESASSGRKYGDREESSLPDSLEGFIPDIQAELRFWFIKYTRTLNIAKILVLVVGILDALGVAFLSDRLWIIYAVIASAVLTLLLNVCFPRWRTR